MSRPFQSAIIGALSLAVAVILWGAWVRISGSGDGCGAHWPLCHGTFLPEASAVGSEVPRKTWVEFAHRVTSGAFGLLIFALFLWSRRIFPKPHPARRAATLMLLFTVLEALLGAKLVLWGLVAKDASLYRAVVAGLHLSNTLLLLASITAVWFFSRFAEPPLVSVPTTLRSPLAVTVTVFLLVGMTGAWGSLASTLFPVATLQSGINLDLAASSNPIVRIRILHPIAAVLVAVLLWSLSAKIARRSPSRPSPRPFRSFLLFAIAFGLATLLLLSPVPMKIAHLLVADILWIWTVTIILEAITRGSSNQSLNLGINE